MKTPKDGVRDIPDLDNIDDRQFVENAQELFAESVERLDAATLSKLNRGRQAAIAEISSTTAHYGWLRWMPAAGLAAAAVVAVVMLQGPATVDLPDGSESAATDFEILLGDDSLEMIEELEFYSWIDVADLDDADNVG